MPFSYELDKSKNLIVITYDETTSYEDRIKVLDQLVDYLIHHPTTKIFVDVSDAATVMTDEQQLEYGQLLASKKHHFRQNRTAILKRDANPHPYILASAYSDGFSNFVEFENRKEAMMWLHWELR